MILKFFRGTSPGVILVIILTLGALWAGAFIEPQPRDLSLYEITPMPLYKLVQNLFVSYRAVGIISTLILTGILLFLLVNFNTTIFFINERTFLPAILYLLLVAVFPELQVWNPVLPASICLMLALFRIMDSYRKAGDISNFFDAGILIGTGSLFYGNMLWFGILPLIGIILLRTVGFKDIILSLLGLATPYIFLFGIYYALDYDLNNLLADIILNLAGNTPAHEFPVFTVIVLIWTGLILIVSTGFLVNQISSKKIKSRKAFNLLLALMVLSALLFLILKSVSAEMIWIFGIPASYILTHYFIFARKKIISETAFSILFLLVLLLQALHIFL